LPTSLEACLSRAILFNCEQCLKKLDNNCHVSRSYSVPHASVSEILFGIAEISLSVDTLYLKILNYTGFVFLLLPNFAGNLFSNYLGKGEVLPGVKGDEHYEIVSDITTSFVMLCAIYFPSVTGIVKIYCLYSFCKKKKKNSSI